jgi:hypothetical protein
MRPLAVYGPDNVTSGCISDLARATDVATRMVQVCAPRLLLLWAGSYINARVYLELWVFAENWACVLRRSRPSHNELTEAWGNRSGSPEVSHR